MKMGNLGRGAFDVSKVEFIKSDVVPEPIHRLRFGDVLFNTRNTLDLVGKVAMWRDELSEAYYNSNLMRLEFEHEEICAPAYANAALNSSVSISLLRGMATGTTSVAAIYTRDLMELPLAKPPLPEQRAIAEALSDVDGLLGGLDRLIAKKRDLKQAAMQQLLTAQTRLPGFSSTWIDGILGQFISRCFSGATPRRNRPEFYKGTIRWITSGELNYNVITDTIEKISEDAVTETNLAVLPAGTFLMAITGLEAEGTRGACGIVGAPATTNQSCMAIFPTPKLRTEFLFHYYVFRGKTLALKFCQGTKQQSYTAGLVKQIPISMPSDPAEQTAIAEVLSEMDAELEALERRREKTRALKQAMMQQLLTGQIRLVTPTPAKVIPVDFTSPVPKPAPISPVVGVPAGKKHNWAINEAVVVSVLVKHFGSEKFPLGRKRCTKLSYLLHRHVEHVAQGYLKKAAGPYNPAVKYGGPEGIAQKNGYIRPHKNGTYSGFIAAEKIAQAERYFAEWYGPDVLRWLDQFRFKSNDDLERLATVDMAMEELRRAGAAISLDSVRALIASDPEWVPKLDRSAFSDHNITSAIQQCRTLFPT